MYARGEREGKRQGWDCGFLEGKKVQIQHMSNSSQATTQPNPVAININKLI
jgi:hypothetical protein